MLVQNVSTLGVAMKNRDAVADTQRQLMELQQEQVTGKKHDVAGDLGIRAARLVAMRNAFQEGQEYLLSNELAGSRMEITQAVMTSAGGAVESFITTVVAGMNVEAGSALVQDAARDLIDNLRGALNSSNGGRYLFAGVAVDTPPVQAADQVNATTGFGPLEVIQNVIAAKPPVTDAATLADLLQGPDGIASVFDDSHSNAAWQYGATFYNGATIDVTAKVDVMIEVKAALRADAAGVRQVMESAYALAAIDRTTMPKPQYQALLEKSLENLYAGLDEMRAGQAALGLVQQTVERAQSRHRLVSEVLTRQVNALEQADPYETAVRLSSLTSQIEATFSITARLSQLSLVNYL